MNNETINWKAVEGESLDHEILRPVSDPFDAEGGLRLVDGNLGRAMIKVSAVSPEHYRITAEARVFESQLEFTEAFKAGELYRDLVAVLPHHGPRANGMPELHKLTPYLGLLQNRGHKVALLTDGRMSGASGKVLAAIQVTPEAVDGGLIGKIRDGDLVQIDAEQGVLSVETQGEPLRSRQDSGPDLSASHTGMGRELFAAFRNHATSAESGASIFSEID
jgi:phosphogluconate dehydratase